MRYNCSHSSHCLRHILFCYSNGIIYNYVNHFRGRIQNWRSRTLQFFSSVFYHLFPYPDLFVYGLTFALLNSLKSLTFISFLDYYHLISYVLRKMFSNIFSFMATVWPENKLNLYMDVKYWSDGTSSQKIDRIFQQKKNILCNFNIHRYIILFRFGAIVQNFSYYIYILIWMCVAWVKNGKICPNIY